LNEPNDSEKD